MNNQDGINQCFYENVVTASLDILGFKSIVCQTNGHEKAKRIISNLYKNLYIGKRGYSSPDFNSDYVEMFSVSEEFSDSIFYFSDPDLSINEQLGRLLPTIIRSLLIGVFVSDEKYLLRAGISIGNLMVSEIHIDKNIKKTIHIGTSIIKAHELEADQDWFGGAISEELADYLSINNKHYIEEYAVPSKKHKIKYALNWLSMLIDLNSLKHPEEPIVLSEDIFIEVKKVFKETGPINEQVRKKINNTFEFIKHVKRIS